MVRPYISLNAWCNATDLLELVFVEDDCQLLQYQTSVQYLYLLVILVDRLDKHLELG